MAAAGTDPAGGAGEKNTAAAEPISAECDLVLEGGITSGVVFPLAIVRLAEKYRFRNIGGTSVGAIAAAGAAAAEYGRATGAGKGFARLAAVPDYLGGNLSSLFQPQPGYRRLFNLLRLALAKGGVNRFFAPIGAYWLGFIFAVVAWAALSVPVFLDAMAGKRLDFLGDAKGVYLFLLLLVEMAIISVFCIGAFFAYDLLKLKQNDFGLCRGARAGKGKPALMDWVHDVIQEAAGLDRDDPLTFGHLKDKDIVFRAMTTNLSLGVGYALPFAGNDRLFFSKSELEGMIPAGVLAAMAQPGKKIKAGPQEDFSGLDDLYAFPDPDKLPVLVAVRMSMSFPLLFSAFPLYRFDKGDRNRRPARMLFSDGGVTSNFPVRFFDSPVPRRPTFGLLLEDLKRGGVVTKGARGDGRVHLPFPVADGTMQEIAAIGDLPGFVSALFKTARTWQDRKHARIAGFRERVARVYLDKDEGGLNLDMPEATIRELASFGARAADLLDGAPAQDRFAFDFADHQWRRFVVAYAEAERLLGDFAERWNKEVGASIKATAEGEPTWGDKIDKQTRAMMIRRFDDLAQCARSFSHELRHGFPPESRGLRMEIVPHDEWP